MIEWILEVEDVDIACPVDDMKKGKDHNLACRGDGVREGVQGFRVRCGRSERL